MKRMKQCITAATICAVTLSSTVPTMAAENGTQETSKAISSGSWGFDLDDAAQTLAFALKIKAPETADFQDLDADGDGVIDLNDAHQVLRYALKIDAPTHPKGVRVETVQGTTYQMKFVETEPASSTKYVHDTAVYENDEGTTAKYDQETGQLVYFYTKGVDGAERKIDEEEAELVAENFICTQCDFSKYALVESYYDQDTGYQLRYSRIVDGYETSEKIWVHISNYGMITYFYYIPYIFDDIQVPDIDEEAALKEVERQVVEQYGDSLVRYDIERKWLDVGEDSKVMLRFDVDVCYSTTAPLILMNGITIDVEI